MKPICGINVNVLVLGLSMHFHFLMANLMADNVIINDSKVFLFQNFSFMAYTFLTDDLCGFENVFRSNG